MCVCVCVCVCYWYQYQCIYSYKRVADIHLHSNANIHSRDTYPFSLLSPRLAGTPSTLLPWPPSLRSNQILSLYPLTYNPNIVTFPPVNVFTICLFCCYCLFVFLFFFFFYFFFFLKEISLTLTDRLKSGKRPTDWYGTEIICLLYKKINK